MRILLIHMQLFVLLLFTAAAALVAAAAGGIAGAIGSGAAVAAGPAALGGIIFIPMIVATAAIGAVAFAVPLGVLSSFTLLFAFTAGYRFLRWSRFCGVAANVAGIVYFLVLHHYAAFTSGGTLAWLLALPVVNILLFLLMPRLPSYRLTRMAVTVLVPMLHLAPFGLLVCLLLTQPDSLGAAAAVAIVALVCAYPFYFVFRTIPLTDTINAALGKRLAITAGVTLIALFIFPVLLPLGLAVLLLLQLAEIAFLYPDRRPDVKSAHFWAARVLGRLPDAAADISEQAPEAPTGEQTPPAPEAAPDGTPPFPDRDDADGPEQNGVEKVS